MRTFGYLFSISYILFHHLFLCVRIYLLILSTLNNVHELSDVNGMMKMVEARIERKILRWWCVDILLFCSCKDDISSFIVNECQLFLSFYKINVGNVSAIYDILRWKIAKIMEFQFFLFPERHNIVVSAPLHWYVNSKHQEEGTQLMFLIPIVCHSGYG